MFSRIRRPKGLARAVAGRCCFGYTPGGEFIIVVYDEVDEDAIRPVTAYEVPEP
jgi:hypothetical protein